MGVIVMGMEIPENCGRCRFIGSCGVHGNEEWPDIESIMFNDVIGIDGKRDKECPLRPLPKKHGRLIDADAFIGTIRPIVEEDDYAGCTFRTVKELMTEHIDEAQTIVEAEGE